mmetsp:Transcript_3176/g.6565  ORF Transcript_3176/g.6565 Transcript_3176/m.6565 type:complete len:85 (+) Transcript_3176:284-538(+)
MRSVAGATATLTLCPEELVRWGFRREAGIGTTDGGTAADCGCCDGTRALRAPLVSSTIPHLGDLQIGPAHENGDNAVSKTSRDR